MGKEEKSASDHKSENWKIMRMESQPKSRKKQYNPLIASNMGIINLDVLELLHQVKKSQTKRRTKKSKKLKNYFCKNKLMKYSCNGNATLICTRWNFNFLLDKLSWFSHLSNLVIQFDLISLWLSKNISIKPPT